MDVHAVERDLPVHGEFPVYVTIQPRSSCQATLTVLEPLVVEQWYHQLFETTYLHLKSYSAAVFAQPSFMAGEWKAVSLRVEAQTNSFKVFLLKLTNMGYMLSNPYEMTNESDRRG